MNSLVMNKKKAIVSDECLNQADERYNFGNNTIQNHSRTAKPKITVKNNLDKPASQAAAVSAASEEREKTLESSSEGGVGISDQNTTAWSQNQQKQLELALQQFPKTVPNRWTCIAQAVPGKTKVNQRDSIVSVSNALFAREKKGLHTSFSLG